MLSAFERSPKVHMAFDDDDDDVDKNDDDDGNKNDDDDGNVDNSEHSDEEKKHLELFLKK